MNRFQDPMQPFPGLEEWARAVALPSSGIHLYLYDTDASRETEEGQTPVVLLHGLGDEADTWRHVLPLVSQKQRAIAPDLPGFGRSEKPRRKYTVPFYVETVLELLDALAIPKAVLTGHSMGAVIAQAAALAHPERVERLVLVSGSLAAQSSRIDLGLLLFLIPGVGEWLYTRLRKDPQAAYQTLAPYYHRLEDLPQAERDFLYQRVNERVWSDGQRRAFFSALRGLAGWLPGQQKNLLERLKDCRTPTHAVWGEDDRITPVANAHALVELLPAARLEVVPGSGHNVQQEQPAAVAAAIVAAIAAKN